MSQKIHGDVKASTDKTTYYAISFFKAKECYFHKDFPTTSGVGFHFQL